MFSSNKMDFLLSHYTNWIHIFDCAIQHMLILKSINFWWQIESTHKKNMFDGTMWGPQDSVQLVYNSNFTMVYGTYNYSYWGESKPTNITGGAHIVEIPCPATLKPAVAAVAASMAPSKLCWAHSALAYAKFLVWEATTWRFCHHLRHDITNRQKGWNSAYFGGHHGGIRRHGHTGVYHPSTNTNPVFWLVGANAWSGRDQKWINLRGSTGTKAFTFNHGAWMAVVLPLCIYIIIILFIYIYIYNVENCIIIIIIIYIYIVENQSQKAQHSPMGFFVGGFQPYNFPSPSQPPFI